MRAPFRPVAVHRCGSRGVLLSPLHELLPWGLPSIYPVTPLATRDLGTERWPCASVLLSLNGLCGCLPEPTDNRQLVRRLVHIALTSTEQLACLRGWYLADQTIKSCCGIIVKADWDTSTYISLVVLLCPWCEVLRPRGSAHCPHRGCSSSTALESQLM